MTSRFSLVVQSFGREYEYRRAVLTILSFYAYTENSNHPVLIYTDNPGWFEPWLGGLPVHYEQLTPERIRHMRGSIDFLHRMKIAEIEHAMTSTGRDILYADSDTFFMANPEGLMAQLDERTAFMHLHEYRFAEADLDWRGEYGKTMTAFIGLLQHGHFLTADGDPFPVSLEDSSWNAGVMFLHHSQARLLADVYTLTDQFFPTTRNHASEQYAFSLVLQRHVQLRPCEQVIYHYWYHAKKRIADEFLARELSPAFLRLPLQDRLSRVRQWVKALPGLFDRHPIMIRDHAIQAFNEGRTWKGYQWSARLLFKSPRLFFPFLRDIAYFTLKANRIRHA